MRGDALQGTALAAGSGGAAGPPELREQPWAAAINSRGAGGCRLGRECPGCSWGSSKESAAPKGIPGLRVGDTWSCKNNEGLGSREMGRGTERGSAVPWGAEGTTQRPSWLSEPDLTVGFYRVQSKTPWRSWGQQSPGSQGPCWPCRWPGGVKPVASWAALENGKWGSPQPLPHAEGAAAQSPVLCSANTPL